VTDDALALAFRTGLPFVGLRDHQHDPDLDRLLPPDAARAARVVPLAADGDHLRLAVADPEADIAALSPYIAGLDIELAVATEEEVEAILGPPPRRPLTPAPPPLVAERQAAEPELLAAEPELLAAEPELLAAEPEAAEPEAPELDPAEPAGQPLAVEPASVASVFDDPELDGQTPSWLEPPRRRRKAVVAALVVLTLLIVAAGALTAYVLTR
jgi:Type II secretion system (T2SS), protein E, N-terminal domain